MINQRLTHRCLLTEIASGENIRLGKPTNILQTLLLIGFITRQPIAGDLFKLSLTDAGHRYLAGLWH